MSKISVIIPCYNAEKYIKKCFEGLEKQTFREFDVIVVDDFSTDNSLNILYEIKHYLFDYILTTYLQQMSLLSQLPL